MTRIVPPGSWPVCGALLFGTTLTATSTTTSITTGQFVTVAAHSQRVTLKGPKRRYADQVVRLRGRTDARRVKIERKKGRRWVTERKAKVRGNKRYAVTVQTPWGARRTAPSPSTAAARSASCGCASRRPTPVASGR